MTSALVPVVVELEPKDVLKTFDLVSPLIRHEARVLFRTRDDLQTNFDSNMYQVQYAEC